MFDFADGMKYVETMNLKIALDSSAHYDNIITVRGKPKEGTDMADTFKTTRRNDWDSSYPDVLGIGHVKRRNAYRKKQNRRTRRVLKQEFQKELF